MWLVATVLDRMALEEYKRNCVNRGERPGNSLGGWLTGMRGTLVLYTFSVSCNF